ncbi:MAG: hypothetical protein IPG81_24580 [Sandaracinaceae bacterium]|nr:hypothetical protein [Sandaracinaceae bacterium]
MQEAATDMTAGFSGEVATRADQRVVLRFSAAAAEASTVPSASSEAPPWGDVTVTVVDQALALPDALFLLTVLLLTEHHQDAFLHRAHPWAYVDARTQRRFEPPHPPRIETSQALLGSVPVPTRVRLLIEACELAVPIWTAWAKVPTSPTSMASWRCRRCPGSSPSPPSPRCARLEDGDPKPLTAWSGEYRSLHWPMLEDNWSVPPNVHYGLFALQPGGLRARGRSLTAALTCVQQATAARATNAQDQSWASRFGRRSSWPGGGPARGAVRGLRRC